MNINDVQTSTEQEESLIEFFIEIGHLIPNVASANAVLQILKCFSVKLVYAQLHKICIFYTPLYFCTTYYYC